MKKIITLVFCIGLFTASFAQGGNKRNRGTGNEVTRSQDNRGANSNTSGYDKSYNQGPQRSGSYNNNNRHGQDGDRDYGYQRHDRAYRTDGYNHRRERRHYDERSYNYRWGFHRHNSWNRRHRDSWGY